MCFTNNLLCSTLFLKSQYPWPCFLYWCDQLNLMPNVLPQGYHTKRLKKVNAQLRQNRVQPIKFKARQDCLIFRFSAELYLISQKGLKQLETDLETARGATWQLWHERDKRWTGGEQVNPNHLMWWFLKDCKLCFDVKANLTLLIFLSTQTKPTLEQCQTASL